MEKIYKGEIQRLLPIFQAMADGRIIQFSSNGNYWIDIDGEEEGLLLDTLIGNPKNYRIKPEPTYRPFKDVKECWNEMNGIYSTSVCEETIDEAPMAYKPTEEIVELIKPTVDVIDVIKPIYNFKAKSL